MKVANKFRVYLRRVWRSMFLKYAVVTIAGILIVGFLDDNSVWHHVQNLRQIQELTKEKEKYISDFERDRAQIKELDRNPKAIEKIARERYFMKADDEDIFVLSDDDRTPKPIVSHETIE